MDGLKDTRMMKALGREVEMNTALRKPGNVETCGLGGRGGRGGQTTSRGEGWACGLLEVNMVLMEFTLSEVASL